MKALDTDIMSATISTCSSSITSGQEMNTFARTRIMKIFFLIDPFLSLLYCLTYLRKYGVCCMYVCCMLYVVCMKRREKFTIVCSEQEEDVVDV